MSIYYQRELTIEQIYKVDYTPHPGQRKWHSSKARFRIGAIGRQWGKTLSCGMEVLDTVSKKPESRICWVAPIYDQTRIIWELFSKLPPAIIVKKSESRLELDFYNGSRLYCRSGDHPERLEGRNFDRVVLDEAPKLKRQLWENSITPALARRKGDALIIGTPKGKNWYHELFLRGRDPGYANYDSFNFPSSDNPYLDPMEIERARLELPDTVFRQEYLAEFLGDGAGVFRNIKGCYKGNALGRPAPGWRYTMGVDLAKHQDFTVLTVLDKNKHLVDFARFNKIEWPFQKARILKYAKKWNNSRIILDATGIGDVIYDDLKRAGASVYPYKFTNESKKVLIEGMMVDMEQNRTSYPNCPETEVMVGEFEIFGYEMTRAGNVRYNAPEGYHDDCVIAYALALFGARKPQFTQKDITDDGALF